MPSHIGEQTSHDVNVRAGVLRLYKIGDELGLGDVVPEQVFYRLQQKA